MAEIAIGEKRVCAVGDREVLLCNVGGSFFAVENRCSHGASKLDGGQLFGLILDRGKINIVQPTTSASAINR